ncbi:MAG: hydrogenase 3 maturation endopeptidase HyCI [Candidatus Aenigmarchaeota archaeon]|nr:hydrogenase 3 maturation endopeptidase HyCI [Candidatus Aenigmarchaeota archaeon]
MADETADNSGKSFLERFRTIGKKLNPVKEKVKPLTGKFKSAGKKISKITEKLHIKRKRKSDIEKKIELPKNAKPAMPEIQKLFEKYEKSTIKPEFRFAVMGIGNDLKGDDGVGWYVIDKLKKILPKENALLMKTSTPENHVKDIRDFCPGILIIVDSASFGGRPGQIRKIEEHEIQRIFYSTHTTPLTIFMKLLKQDILATKVIVIGIQKKQTEFGIPMSSGVKRSGDRIIKMICDLNDTKTMEKGMDGAIMKLSSSGSSPVKNIFKK